jgi:hypothetical protein
MRHAVSEAKSARRALSLLEPRDEHVKSKSTASLPKRYSQVVREQVE